MSTCTLCGASAWHPELRARTVPGCELRGRATELRPAPPSQTSRGATSAASTSEQVGAGGTFLSIAIASGSPNPLPGRVLPVASAAAPRRAGGGYLDPTLHRALVEAGYAPLPDYVRHQGAREGEADRAGRMAERVAIHGEAA